MRGVVRLPFAVLFSEDALGSSLSGATARVVFTLSLPRLPADADGAGFLLESPKDEAWPCTETLGAMAWGYLGFEGRSDGRRILASWVNRVAIEIETYDEDRQPWQVAATFGPKFNLWYANWLEWVSICTGSPSAIDRGMAIKLSRPCGGALGVSGAYGMGVRCDGSDLRLRLRCDKSRC
jgi:hypothetical protein